MENQKRILMQTSSLYLRQLVTDINNNKMGVPLFQRKFVWTREQIRDLFDSILRGYPIGSFLIWERDGEWKGIRGMLNDDEDYEAEPDSYILDGRQRLTSFYGCTLDDENKPAIFDLWYNLKNQGFEYNNKNRDVPHLMRVSDIFDTFRLLDRMDKLREKCTPEEASLYISKAKELNAILQEYVVSRVAISQCSLDEATDVFARLNSKGTDISKAFMLQALSYKKQGDRLLVPVLESIAAMLDEYNYGSISIDALLNACFKFENKNFYDLSLKDMSILMPLRFENEIRATVLNVVRFLYNECNVISWTLMPYSKQFQALIWFFRKYSEPNASQRTELKKWFYYTTLNLSFQNGSLGNTRAIFSRFNEYIDQCSGTAIDYNEVIIDRELDFQPSAKSAVSKLFFLTLVNNYIKSISGVEKFRYSGHCHLGGTSPENYFVILREEDSPQLNRILTTSEPYTLEELTRHSLNDEMVKAYRKGDMEKFRNLRRDYIFASRIIQFKEIMPDLM